jgi:hypothetical protein
MSPNEWISVYNDPQGISRSTLVDGVTQCYLDFRNAALAVQYCVDWTVQGVRGMSDADRENILIDIRRAISSQSDKP